MGEKCLASEEGGLPGNRIAAKVLAEEAVQFLDPFDSNRKLAVNDGIDDELEDIR
jgi:hypothetical protein